MINIPATLAPQEADAASAIMKAVEHLPIEKRRHVLERIAEDQQLGLRNLQQQLHETKQHLDNLKSLLDWWDSLADLALERNEHSRIHKLKDAARAGKIYTLDEARKSTPTDERQGGALQWLQHTFVVKHDWASAFDGAEGLDSDEIRLPFQICSFEFRISGRSVVAYAFENDGKMADNGEIPPVGFSVLIECGDEWYSFDNLNGDQRGAVLGQFLWDQIRAICIALDAEVATHEVVRAPAKLNEKRAKAGRSPLPDYMVIDLARRHRVVNPSSGSGEGTRKRLHFRRGHWRHYETHKTWIRWCLVGDPSLGFVGKHYAL